MSHNAKMQHGPTIITGASSGIGEAAARALRKAGHTLVITGRSSRTAEVAAEIGADHFLVDYERLADVKAFAAKLLDRYPRIDVLVNNAGAIYGKRRVTADGHEATFQVNHLGGFLLTCLLRERLEESNATVINTASRAHRFGRLDFSDLESEHHYNAARAYGTSKLMNILHAMEINRRFEGVRAVSFHPGGVATRFARDAEGAMRWVYASRLGRMFMISPEKGAGTLLWLIERDEWTPGEYYYKRKPGRRWKQVTDEDARRLWDASSLMLAGFVDNRLGA